MRPILIGRRNVILLRIEQLGLRLKIDIDFELVDPDKDERYREYWELYHSLLSRSGTSINEARVMVRTNNTVIAALMVNRKEADAMICGATGRYTEHLPHLFKIIGLRPGVTRAAAMSMLIMSKGTYFWVDPYVNPRPSGEQIANIAVLAAQNIRRFGIEPKIALLSHSNFGSSNRPTARKMREAVELIRKLAPDLQVDGEMHADAALSEELRGRLVKDSPLTGAANLLVMPSLDAANISYNLVRMLADGLAVGPMLLGMNQPAHILAEGVTARGVMNMTAVAVVEAQNQADGELPL